MLHQKTSVHNHVFLEGVRAALVADKKWNNGNYKKQPVAGLKAFRTSLCRLGLFSKDFL